MIGRAAERFVFASDIERSRRECSECMGPGRKRSSVKEIELASNCSADMESPGTLLV